MRNTHSKSMQRESKAKKGFISLILAIVFVYTALLLLAYYLEVRSASLKTENELLILKNYNARELEVKRAITNTIHHSLQKILLIKPDADSEEVSKYIGINLAALESQEKEYYNTYHLDLNFWCGFPGNESYLNSFKENMIRTRTAIKCEKCKDFGELIPKYSIPSMLEPEKIVEDLVPACTPLISYNKELRYIKISSPPLNYLWIGEEPAIGVSVLDTVNNISSIVIIPKGTIIPI